MMSSHPLTQANAHTFACRGQPGQNVTSSLVERFVSTLQREGNKENQAGRAAATPAGKRGAAAGGCVVWLTTGIDGRLA
jgi:hypothetical protein